MVNVCEFSQLADLGCVSLPTVENILLKVVLKKRLIG